MTITRFPVRAHSTRPIDSTSTMGGHRRRIGRAALFTVIAVIGGITGQGPLGSSAAFAAPLVAPVPLGSAATFAVLTLAAVGNTATGPVTTLHGDLGAGGGTTGFPPGVHTGTLFAGAAADPALADLTIAYADAVGRPAGLPLAADLIGVTVGPGVHTNVAAVANTGTFTIDAGGDPNAVFIFQVGGALAMAAGSRVVLAGQAKASNVFWAVNGAGAVGANATFAGTMMATAAIAVGDGTLFNGRALSKAGAVTMTSSQFYSAAPTVSIDPGSTASSTDTSPTLTGTTSLRSPATVTVTIDGQTMHPVPDGNGVWSATPTGLFANGPHTVTADVIDGAGNTGSSTQILTIDTVPPAITIDGGASVTTNDLTPTFTGTTDVAPGQQVAFTFARDLPSSTSTVVAFVQNDRTWNISPSGFAEGQWTVSASVTDPAGNSSTASQDVTIDTTGASASITSASLSNDPTPTITGTAEDGSSVEVHVDGLRVPTSGDSANWSATYTGTRLADGSHTVSVRVVDIASNETSVIQTLTIDTTAPAIAILPGPTNATNDRTPTISGTTDAAAGQTVGVTISGSSAMSAFVQDDGRWNVTPAAAITPGVLTVVASVTDLAGNIGSFEQSLTIDVTAPVVSITGGPSRLTASATPTISGTVTGAPVGTTVDVTVAAQSLTATVTSSSTWSVTPTAVDNGTHVVVATIADSAGNVGTANQSLSVEAVLPVVSIVGGSAATTGDPTPTIAGSSSAPSHSALLVTVGGQTLRATVQPGGSWNVTAAAILDSTVTVDVTVTDADGNVGAATQQLTIDSGSTTSTTGPPATTPSTTPTTDPPGTTPTTDPPVTTPSTTPSITPLTTPPVTSSNDFTAVGPRRVFDTRPGQSLGAVRQVAKAQLVDSVELRVQFTDLPGLVPASGVDAVSLNVTATGSTAAGFVTVYACGTRELVSSVNFAAGATVANAVISPLSSSGDVCFFSNTATDVIVDVNGWFATGGAFHPVGPKRLFDTRGDSGAALLSSVPETRLAAGGVLEVAVTGVTGFVPATGVSAVSMNVVVTNTEFGGYLTVFACGTRALVSSVNYVAGATVANAVIAPVSATGTVCFYSPAGVDLVVDINGWIATGSSFGPAGPVRVADTRAGESPDALRAVAKARIGGTAVLEIEVADLAGFVPATGVAAVSLNVTAVDPSGAGYINVFPCTAVEEVSSLNFAAGQTVANAVLTPISASGTICLFANVATDVVVDINGWFASSHTG